MTTEYAMKFPFFRIAVNAGNTLKKKKMLENELFPTTKVLKY